MNVGRNLLLCGLSLGSLLAPPAVADSYRCGRAVVRDGDPVSKLLAVCGEPRLRAIGSAMVRVDGVETRAQVQRWHYKNSRRAQEHVVLIYAGRISAIEVGGR